MSRHPKIVPWRDESEISILRDWFYSPDASDPGRAISRIKAYQTRGTQLPQSIEATATLFSALTNDREGNDSYSIRLGYSMAIVRFVNGLLDPYQKSRDAISMYTLAKVAGLPSFFVELRHVATHEGLPSLSLLREGAKRAIDWLWGNFWVLNNHDNSQKEINECNTKRDEVKEQMRQWRRLRRSDPTKVIKSGDGSAEGQQYWKLVKEIISAAKNDEGIFMDVLYMMNVLIPTSKNGDVKKSALEPSVKLFVPLLDALNKELDGFVERLTKYGLELVNSNQPSQFDWVPKEYRDEQQEIEMDEGNEQKQRELYDSIVHWIKHFLEPRNKKTQKAWIYDTTEVIEICLNSPRTWNLEILEHYTSTNPKIDERILKLTKDMATQMIDKTADGDKKRQPQKRKIEDVEKEVGSLVKRVRKDNSMEKSSSSIYGGDWSPCQDWTPRPIGVL